MMNVRQETESCLSVKSAKVKRGKRSSFFSGEIPVTPADARCTPTTHFVAFTLSVHLDEPGTGDTGVGAIVQQHITLIMKKKAWRVGDKGGLGIQYPTQYTVHPTLLAKVQHCLPATGGNTRTNSVLGVGVCSYRIVV